MSVLYENHCRPHFHRINRLISSRKINCNAHTTVPFKSFYHEKSRSLPEKKAPTADR